MAEEFTQEQRLDIKQVYDLFAEAGEGLVTKKMGDVLRSLGYSPNQAALKDMITELGGPVKKITFEQFLPYAARAKRESVEQNADLEKELVPMREGMLHYFQAKSLTQIREDKDAVVKVSDLRRTLCKLGEKLTEEEWEELAKELTVENGNVKFQDFVQLLQSD
mmetsp:Transcript_25145/g.60921  ORF Transcript_25145/g.60921 Transcript_25145/m.60921 type:complete len:164 (-) Transcript_25145:83-574(-)